MPIKTKTFTLLILLILLVLSIFTIVQLQQQTYPTLSGQLSFQRIDGVRQSLAELHGKPLLITFWSPECVLCMAEVTQLNQIYSELRGGENFELLALSMYYDRPDRVIETSLQSGMTYPVYFDLQKTLSNAFGRIVATPTSFLLNSDGKIVYRHAGVLDFTLIKLKLQQLTG